MKKIVFFSFIILLFCCKEESVNKNIDNNVKETSISNGFPKIIFLGKTDSPPSNHIFYWSKFESESNLIEWSSHYHKTFHYDSSNANDYGFSIRLIEPNQITSLEIFKVATIIESVVRTNPSSIDQKDINIYISW
jgi:hypothetical protein